MAKNEVATTEKNFNLVTLTGELKEAVAEELDGLGTLPFERAKIPSGGGLAFELPGETEDEPVMSTDLTGVLIHHHPVNAYWKEEYAGGNVQPDCSSHDGKQGVERETGEIHDCSKCPHNQFGSGKNGSGKACKNIHRCYILQENNPVPIILALPPTSLKYIRDYIGKRILLKGLRCYDAVTKITLKKEKSADGITYSRAAFAFVSKLTDEQRAETSTRVLEIYGGPFDDEREASVMHQQSGMNCGWAGPAYIGSSTETGSGRWSREGRHGRKQSASVG